MSDDIKAQVGTISNSVTSLTDASHHQALAEKEKGNAFYKQKNFEEALKCYTRASELDPQDITFITNKAGNCKIHPSICIEHNSSLHISSRIFRTEGIR